MSFNFSPKIVTDGLALYLDAANQKSYDGTGIIWSDLSKNKNYTSLVNGPTFSNENCGSIIFDGIDDYCVTPVGLTPSLNITSQITLETWIKPADIANINQGSGIISKGLSTDLNSAVYELILSNNTTTNRPSFRMRIGASAQLYSPTNIPININQIYNITCTYNGSIMRIFINGIESGPGLLASGSIQSNTQQLAIGVRYVHIANPTFDSYFSGNIYLSKIYNRALSETEITQNYNALKSRFKL